MFPLYRWVYIASCSRKLHTLYLPSASTAIPGLPWHNFGVVDGLGVIDLQEIDSAGPPDQNCHCPNPPLENGLLLKSTWFAYVSISVYVGVSSFSLSFDGDFEGYTPILGPIPPNAKERCGSVGIQLWSSSNSRGAWNATKRPGGNSTEIISMGK